MKSPCADKYLREIKKICPSYTGPRRGRGQAFFLSTLDEDERGKLMFLENKEKKEKKGRKKEKKEKENLEPAEKKLEDFGHFDFLDNEMEEPVFFESYLN